jgi:hypothetical protein
MTDVVLIAACPSIGDPLSCGHVNVGNRDEDANASAA